jgi:hypothetical protein
MSSLDNKLIIYDSNCKVCSFMKDLILAVTSIPEKKIVAFNHLEQALKSRVDAERFRNEMALIDLGNEATLYGPQGIALIFGSRSKILKRLLAIKPVFSLFYFLYRVLAYNRYIIAVPKNSFFCDCYPDKIAVYRIAYIIITVCFSVMLTFLFGISLKNFFPDMSYGKAAIEMLFIAGSGWVLQIILALVLLKNNAMEYIGHLGSIMVVGLLILLPSMILTSAGIQSMYIPIFSVLCSSGYMLYMHIGRVKFLQLSPWWNFSWFAFLQSTAMFWLYYFHIK